MKCPCLYMTTDVTLNSDKYSSTVFIPSVKRFVNKPATLQAQNKIEALKQEFKSYILNNVKYKTQTENNYYNLFLKNKNLELSENTKLLNFPKTVINHPYKHQKEAVLFGLLNQTALFDHKVGHGKTLTMGLLSDKLLNHKKSERIFLMTLKSSAFVI